VEALREALESARSDGPAHVGVVAQQVAAAYPSRQSQLARDETDAPPQRWAARPGALTQHEGTAGGGADDVEQHPEGRRLTCTVRADQPIHAPRLDTDVEPVHG